jgi:hypothetical protein
VRYIETVLYQLPLKQFARQSTIHLDCAPPRIQKDRASRTNGFGFLAQNEKSIVATSFDATRHATVTFQARGTIWWRAFAVEGLFHLPRTRARLEPEINSRLRSKGSAGWRRTSRMEIPGKAYYRRLFLKRRMQSTRRSHSERSATGGDFLNREIVIKENFRTQLIRKREKSKCKSYKLIQIHSYQPPVKSGVSETPVGNPRTRRFSLAGRTGRLFL